MPIEFVGQTLGSEDIAIRARVEGFLEGIPGIGGGGQGKMVTKLKKWFSPYEALKMVTSDNAELLKLSGPRHPYQEGPLGVIAEGAYADMLLVDGNPLENIDLVADADKNFVVIMKDGKIYKNTLH